METSTPHPDCFNQQKHVQTFFSGINWETGNSLISSPVRSCVASEDPIILCFSSTLHDLGSQSHCEAPSENRIHYLTSLLIGQVDKTWPSAIKYLQIPVHADSEVKHSLSHL